MRELARSGSIDLSRLSTSGGVRGKHLTDNDRAIRQTESFGAEVAKRERLDLGGRRSSEAPDRDIRQPLAYTSAQLKVAVGNATTWGSIKNSFPFLGRTTYGYILRQAEHFEQNAAGMSKQEQVDDLRALKQRIDAWQAGHGDASGPAPSAKERGVASMAAAVRGALHAAEAELILSRLPEPTRGEGCPPEARKVARQIGGLHDAVVQHLHDAVGQGLSPSSDQVKDEIANLLNEGTKELRDNKNMKHLPLQDQAAIFGLIKELDLGERVMPRGNGEKTVVSNLQKTHMPLAPEFDYNSPSSSYSKNKAALFEAVVNDPQIDNLFKGARDTHQIKSSDLDKALKLIVEKQGEIFGFDEPKNGIRLFRSGDADYGDAPGRANYSQGTLAFNLPKFTYGVGLHELLGAAAHENLHNWQYQMMDGFASGRIDKDENPDLHHTVKVFDFNSEENYMLNTGNEGENYKMTALERVAHDIGGEKDGMSDRFTGGLMEALRAKYPPTGKWQLVDG